VSPRRRDRHLARATHPPANTRTGKARGEDPHARGGREDRRLAPGQALGDAWAREDHPDARHSPRAAERLSARAIHEGKNLEAVVIEIFDAARPK